LFDGPAAGESKQETAGGESNSDTRGAGVATAGLARHPAAPPAGLYVHPDLTTSPDPAPGASALAPALLASIWVQLVEMENEARRTGAGRDTFDELYLGWERFQVLCNWVAARWEWRLVGEALRELGGLPELVAYQDRPRLRGKARAGARPRQTR
jgi:hypothetical protein